MPQILVSTPAWCTHRPRRLTQQFLLDVMPHCPPITEKPKGYGLENCGAPCWFDLRYGPQRLYITWAPSDAPHAQDAFSRGPGWY